MYDVIIIGAGPAGMMASIKAASNNKTVLLIEKNDSLGKKLLITGGTRCNLINLKSVNDFIKEIPVNNKTLYSALCQFGPQDIYDYFTSINIPLKVETGDRVFPVSNKSKTIVDALTNQMNINEVIIKLNESVQTIITAGECKLVITDKGSYQTNNIIITTGGCSYPQTGSTGDGYQFAKTIQQKVTKLYPAETFLISKDTLPLAGITLDNVSISLDKKTVNGSLIFTHTGLSGPAVFKISEVVYQKLLDCNETNVNIDLIPDFSNEQILTKLNNYNQIKLLSSFMKEYLPKRLVDYIINEFKLDDKISNISKVKRNQIIEILKAFKVNIKATGTLNQSFVTGGGIDMKYINPKTMESTINKGVYFAGEVLDIHGHTGGYNITIALSTGYVAGANIV